MTQSLPGPQMPMPGPDAWPPTTAPITVLAYDCGHLAGDLHDEECAYWLGVAAGDYPPPYMGADVIVLPPHCPGLTPLVDPALRGAA